MTRRPRASYCRATVADAGALLLSNVVFCEFSVSVGKTLASSLNANEKRSQNCAHGRQRLASDVAEAFFTLRRELYGQSTIWEPRQPAILDVCSAERS